MIGLGASSQKGVQGRHDNRLADAQHIWVSFPGGHAVYSAVKAESNEYYPSFGEHKVVEDYFRSCHEARKARMGDKARLQAFVGTIFPGSVRNSVSFL
jgi:hypothetical protein